MSWPVVKLGDVAERVDYGLTASAKEDNEGPRFLRITDMQDDAVDWSTVPSCECSEKEFKENELSVGDIVFARTGATTGKSFLIRHLPRPSVFASYLIRVRPTDEVDSKYLAYFFKSPQYWFQITAMAEGAAQPGVNSSKLKELEIPLPPLPEQKRIAAILDKADAIRRKRQQAIQLADDFLRAVFLDMFGDPVTNPKGWKTACLEELVKVVSGATPSKSNDAYWAGEFPWVSPKDMKSVEISSSIDHVNQVVFERENLKKLPVGSVLIVVRGMILAHTVPVGITTTEVAINQDIKAFVSSGRVLPEFLLWFLLSQHANLLSKVTTAAHGTKRFDMVDLLGLPVFVPDIGAQRKFVSIVGSYKETLAELDWSHKNALQIFNSLSQKAFSGQL